MNKKGFTLVELLATLVILGIVVGITVVTIGGSFRSASDKTEDIFVNTIRDALDIYLDTDAKQLSYPSTSSVCINKRSGLVKVYKATQALTFEAVLNSSYAPLTYSDLVNPANKDKDNYQCFKAVNGNINYGVLNIYRDDDWVYYYSIDKANFGCLNGSGLITNLPDTVSC